MFQPEDYIENGIDKFIIDNRQQIPLIGAVKINNEIFGRLDIIINRYYNGQMEYLPILRDFNKITDDSELKIGKIIELPDVSFIEQNLSITEILYDDEIIPGINKSTNNKLINNSNIISSTKTTASPKLKITQDKVTYDEETGVLKF